MLAKPPLPSSSRASQGNAVFTRGTLKKALGGTARTIPGLMSGLASVAFGLTWPMEKPKTQDPIKDVANFTDAFQGSLGIVFEACPVFGLQRQRFMDS